MKIALFDPLSIKNCCKAVWQLFRVGNKPYLNPISGLLQKARPTKAPSALIAGDPRFKLAVSGRGEVATPRYPAARLGAHDTSPINCFIVAFQSPADDIFLRNDVWYCRFREWGFSGVMRRSFTRYGAACRPGGFIGSFACFMAGPLFPLSANAGNFRFMCFQQSSRAATAFLWVKDQGMWNAKLMADPNLLAAFLAENMFCRWPRVFVRPSRRSVRFPSESWQVLVSIEERI